MRWLLSLGIFLFACQSEYSLRLSFAEPESAAAARQIDVAIIANCAEQVLGSDPLSPIHLVTFDADEQSPPLGEVEPGGYGLYARAISEDCRVIAAGCTPVTLEERGDAALVVQLGTLDLPSCGVGESCEGGRCISADALVFDGGVRDVDPVDVGGTTPDASPDASSGADSGSTDSGTDGGPEDVGVDADPADPLIAHYTCEAILDGQLNDETGNGHTGFCVGGCPTIDVGRTGNACVFDGGTARVRVPNHPDFDPTAGFSVSVWARPTAVSDMSIVGVPYGINNGNTWQVYIPPEGDGIGSNFVSDHGMGVAFLRGPPLTVDNWVHIAIVYDTEGKSIYVDGFLGAARRTDPIVFDNQDLWIGADMNAGVLAHPTIGSIDEIKFFNRALTGDEVESLFATGSI